MIHCLPELIEPYLTYDERHEFRHANSDGRPFCMFVGDSMELFGDKLLPGTERAPNWPAACRIPRNRIMHWQDSKFDLLYANLMCNSVEDELLRTHMARVLQRLRMPDIPKFSPVTTLKVDFNDVDATHVTLRLQPYGWAIVYQLTGDQFLKELGEVLKHVSFQCSPVINVNLDDVCLSSWETNDVDAQTRVRARLDVMAKFYEHVVRPSDHRWTLLIYDWIRFEHFEHSETFPWSKDEKIIVNYPSVTISL